MPLSTSTLDALNQMAALANEVARIFVVIARSNPAAAAQIYVLLGPLLAINIDPAVATDDTVLPVETDRIARLRALRDEMGPLRAKVI